MPEDYSERDIQKNSIEGHEAIILAGGLGTRLRETVPDLPKSLALVNGRPFLFYLINHLRNEGIGKFIFSLGHQHEKIKAFLEEQFPTLRYECIIENEPLGTGGAIQAACYRSTNKYVVVANGDTLYKASLEKLTSLPGDFDCAILLKPMENFDRYGVVELGSNSRITGFKEKKYYVSGLINGGIYLINTESFMEEGFPEKFSFEKDYLEKLVAERKFYGIVDDSYFIDIGVPQDYEKVQKDLRKEPLDLRKINKDWTLFLDRDGVINFEKEDDYVRNWEEFRFYPGVLKAINILSKKFGRMIIVSNQRGVGRGLMTENDLGNIHHKLRQEIESEEGHIDAIYYCTSVDSRDPNRKPNPGMALQAKKDIPGINFSKSIIAGNKPSDMLFGQYAGMYTVFIASTHPETPFPGPDIDERFNSLLEFAEAL